MLQAERLHHHWGKEYSIQVVPVVLIVVVAVPLFDGPPGFAVAAVVVAVVVVAAAAVFSSCQTVVESIQNTLCEEHYGKWLR